MHRKRLTIDQFVPPRYLEGYGPYDGAIRFTMAWKRG